MGRHRSVERSYAKKAGRNLQQTALLTFFERLSCGSIVSRGCTDVINCAADCKTDYETLDMSANLAWDRKFR